MGATIHNPDDPLRDLYPTAREAFEAGKRSGEDDTLEAVMRRLSTLSVEMENQGSAEEFHVAEEACGRVAKLREAIKLEREADNASTN